MSIYQALNVSALCAFFGAVDKRFWRVKTAPPNPLGSHTSTANFPSVLRNCELLLLSGSAAILDAVQMNIFGAGSHH